MLGFIAQLVAALAWPVGAVVIAFLFRKPIAELIGNISKFKVGALEAEVRSALKQLPSGSDKNAEVAGGQKQLPPGSEAVSPSDQDVIDSAPSGAVVQAWAKLEDSLDDAARRLELVEPERRRAVNASTLALRLLKAGAIDVSTFEAITSVRAVRNRIVHSWKEAAKLSPAVADEYVRNTSRLESSVHLGSKRVRTELLLNTLGSARPEDVAVWPLALVGFGPDQQLSERMAIARVGRWGAQSGEHMIEVSSADAQLLLDAGAVQLLANSAGDHELAKRALQAATANKA